tara:strand:- start:3202 stop:3468 length:267 start_codon:yes stop_codon:yes gene_type:complete
MTKITGNFSSYKIELLTISPEDIRNNLLFHEEYYSKELLDFIKNSTDEEIYWVMRTATKNYEFSEEYHMAIADTIDIFKQQHKEKQDE